jgi:hypothetical protein
VKCIQTHLPGGLALLFLACILIPQAQAEDLHAYYTKIDSGEAWELHALTGDYADVAVRVPGRGELIFWRASSYLPHWKTAKGLWYLDELVPRSGDGPPMRPDRINQYAYVRIIENTSEQVVVHWRYVPNFNADPDLSVTQPDFGNVGFDGVVHEVFTVTADGNVMRTVRRGRARLDDFNDPGNVTTQNLRLTTDGVTAGSLNQGKLSGAQPQPIEGAPLVQTGGTAPALHLSFDEGMNAAGDIARDTVSGAEATVLGNKSLWKQGVSGTALGFDGYAAKVILPNSDAPTLTDAFTVAAWAAPGAYSVSKWSGIVLQSTWEALVNENFIFDNHDWGHRQLGEKIASGYFLGIDEFGHVGFQTVLAGKTVAVVSKEPIALYTWAHLAAVVGGGTVTLYVDGTAVDSQEATGALTPSDGDLFVGTNDDRIEYVPKHTVRPYSTFPSTLGFEGLIDEVKVYTRALTEDDVRSAYRSYDGNVGAPDLEPRVLPGQPEDIPQRFGAYYTKLKYHDLWDNLWRTSPWPDIVVKFDDLPTSVVFWRGTTYGANYVTENNRWIGDQSIELTDWHWDHKTTGTNSTCEHMMDRQSRYGHVRIIENTDARVVIHWRYASVDAHYKRPNMAQTDGWGVWTDEYYTIYPDSTTIRYVNSNGATDYYFDPPLSIHFSALQFFFQAGTTPEDNIKKQAVTLANFEGDTAHADFATGSLTKEIVDPHIETINLKSDYKVFLAFKPYPAGERWKGPWEEGWEIEAVDEEADEEEEAADARAEWDMEVGQWADSWRAVDLEPEWGEGWQEGDFVDQSGLLVGPWNHWPVSQFLSDGRNITAADRMSSAEMIVSATGDRSSEAMYGFTDDDITTLIPRAKSWSSPPAIVNNGRVRQHGFNQGQRAFILTALSDSFNFTLQGSEATPINNPCFVIKNWRNADAKAQVSIDDEVIAPGPDFRQGTFYDTDASSHVQHQPGIIQSAQSEPRRSRLRT